jgi:putative acetyltransferase
MNLQNTETRNIRAASRQFVRELDILDGKGCIDNFTLSESHLLMELDEKSSATGKELAESLILEKSTISRIIARLESGDLIRQVPHPTDRRRKPFELTPKGLQLVEEIHRRADLQVNRALSFISGKQRAAVGEALATYAKALGYERRSQGFEIRLIEPRDDKAVADIITGVMTEFGAIGEGYSILDAEVQQMSAYYTAEGSRFFVITAGDRVVGCGGVAHLDGGDPDTCELRKMYFLPELRGKGLGMKLILLCLESARELGYRRVYLETLDYMHQARHLYRKVGFKDINQPMGNTGHCKCNSWMLLNLDANNDAG